MVSACALPHRHSAGRPCWTKTERQGLVDGALGPADDVRDVWTSQTSTAVAARDGAEPIAQPAVRADVQLAAGAFLTGKLVCKPWKGALTLDNNAAWRKVYFAHMYGRARGSELEKVHLAEAEAYEHADGQYLPTAKLADGYWQAQYTKSFVPIKEGYDSLVQRALAHEDRSEHVIEVGHVQHIISHMCNVAEQVAVAAPTPVPKGREACIPNETKMLAHMFFNTLRILKIPRGAALPSKAEFDGPLFVVVRAVHGIWEENIMEVINRIAAKVKDFSAEHKERCSCIFVDKFIESAARWLKYIDDQYAKMNVQRLSCAAIGNREAQRLRQLSLAS